MSTLTLESVDYSARNESEISAWDFIKDVAGNRPYYILEAPKFALDVVIKTMGIAAYPLTRISVVCQKVVNTENFIALFQDVMIIPTQCSKLARSSIEWIKGESNYLAPLNQVRKTVGLFASTLGDFVNSCDAFETLRTSTASAPAFRRWSIFTEKAGAAGSAIGSASRIFDYMIGDLENESEVEFNPSQQKIRDSLASSRNLWNVTRDISILAISVLTVACGGFAMIPSALGVGLSGSILGARLVSYYREVQMKALEEARPSLLIAKKELNA